MRQAEREELPKGNSFPKRKSTGPKSRAFPNSRSIKRSEISPLLQRKAGRGCGGGRIVADHTGLVGVEAALSGGTARSRIRCDRIAVRRGFAVTAEGEHIAALRASRQNAVNQVGASRCCRTARSQRRQRSRIALAVVGRGIRHSSRIDRTQRTDCGRFIGRHTRTEQVRDGNRRDDQNDRHNDQQFDKRETLLPQRSAIR